MFTEEKAYINDQMNQSITGYHKCLHDVGVSSSEVKSNLVKVLWATLEDTKWSTCASLKTFARNCSSILRTCLDNEYAELVLAEDFQRMTHLIYGGLKKTMLRDFNVTSCDIFGGSVSHGDALHLYSHLYIVGLIILYIMLFFS